MSETTPDSASPTSKLQLIVREALEKIFPAIEREISEQIVRSDDIFSYVERELLDELTRNVAKANVTMEVQFGDPQLWLWLSSTENAIEIPLNEIEFNMPADQQDIARGIACADAFIDKFQSLKKRLGACIIAADKMEVPESITVIPAGPNSSLSVLTTAEVFPGQLHILTVLPALPTIDGILIYGPAGSGKSVNSAALAKHYGKTEVLDDWDWRSAPVPEHAIAFTNDDVVPESAIPIAAAMQAAGLS